MRTYTADALSRGAARAHAPVVDGLWWALMAADLAGVPVPPEPRRAGPSRVVIRSGPAELADELATSAQSFSSYSATRRAA